jgi:hypothetical protein
MSGNIYVTGYFFAAVDFDPGGGEDWHNSNGSSDVFLSKFDSSGAFLWAKTWGGSQGEVSHDVVADIAGNAFVAGSFYVTADFDPGPGEDWHTSNGSSDAFLSKFLPDGSW